MIWGCLLLNSNLRELDNWVNFPTLMNGSKLVSKVWSCQMCINLYKTNFETKYFSNLTKKYQFQIHAKVCLNRGFAAFWKRREMPVVWVWPNWGHSTQTDEVLTRVIFASHFKIAARYFLYIFDGNCNFRLQDFFHLGYQIQSFWASMKFIVENQNMW